MPGLTIQNKMNNIVLELPAEEAELFKKFREHQEFFSILLNSRLFEIRNGKALLNFNADGVLTEIKANVTTYKRVAILVPLKMKDVV